MGRNYLKDLNKRKIRRVVKNLLYTRDIDNPDLYITKHIESGLSWDIEEEHDFCNSNKYNRSRIYKRSKRRKTISNKNIYTNSYLSYLKKQI